MQILKSKVGKSRTVECILRCTRSLCYVYYEQSLPFDSYFINSDYYSLDELRNNINQYINSEQKLYEGSRLDYFIIYTNKTEEDLKEFIEWLDNHSHMLNASMLMVTCQ